MLGKDHLCLRMCVVCTLCLQSSHNAYLRLLLLLMLLRLLLLLPLLLLLLLLLPRLLLQQGLSYLEEPHTSLCLELQAELASSLSKSVSLCVCVCVCQRDSLYISVSLALTPSLPLCSGYDYFLCAIFRYRPCPHPPMYQRINVSMHECMKYC